MNDSVTATDSGVSSRWHRRKAEVVGLPLTADYLRSVLDYDPLSGEFRWKWRSDAPSWVNKRLAGQLAGCSHAKRNAPGELGTPAICLRYRTYPVSRLAWLYMTGELPSKYVDHWDTDQTNNRWTNLRLATPGENSRNRRIHKNNKSGYKGVVWHSRLRKWQAQIAVDGKCIYLGVFPTKEEAHASYCEWADEFHGEFSNHGRTKNG